MPTVIIAFCVSTLTRDIDTAILSACPSVFTDSRLLNGFCLVFLVFFCYPLSSILVNWQFLLAYLIDRSIDRSIY